MGTIDSCSYTLACLICKTSETRAILDKGSNWSGSHWQHGAEFDGFITEWTGAGKDEPRLESAKCILCGSEAQRSSRYGG